MWICVVSALVGTRSSKSKKEIICRLELEIHVDVIFSDALACQKVLVQIMHMLMLKYNCDETKSSRRVYNACSFLTGRNLTGWRLR